jgi:hypothetical protein
MSTQTVERTRQQWHQCYLAGERLIEARATWERLYDADEEETWDQAAYNAAERCRHEAMDILLSLLRAAGLQGGAMRLVQGAEGLMELGVDGEWPMAVWREEPVDVRPQRPERLWDGRARHALRTETMEAENVG